jgi:hypothetical protein
MKETPMHAGKTLSLICALALLSACEVKAHRDGQDEATKGGDKAVASAEGKAKEGEFSIDTPGFDMKINLPAAVTNHADSDSDVLYPGSRLSGMHIEAGKSGLDGKGNAGVELRFTTTDAAGKVAAWYRDPARASAFTVVGVRREGSGLLITGSEKEDGDPFTLHLSPRSGGGTEGLLTLTDRS